MLCATETLRLPIVRPPARVRPYVLAADRRRYDRIVPFLGALYARRRLHAGRDTDGNIRLHHGRGLLVAMASNTRAEIERWRALATASRFIEQYDAALGLLDREDAARAYTEGITTRSAAGTWGVQA